ncbi:MAG: hypothetical protein LBG89_03700 [Rickettsiales bacterium]|jgi:hypothetical protein|nr:hypothetical protein [Rickettsiales bacterium]
MKKLLILPLVPAVFFALADSAGAQYTNYTKDEIGKLFQNACLAMDGTLSDGNEGEMYRCNVEDVEYAGVKFCDGRSELFENNMGAQGGPWIDGENYMDLGIFPVAGDNGTRTCDIVLELRTIEEIR